MLPPKEPTDQEKIATLTNAGFTLKKDLWYAPNCMGGWSLYQAYQLWKRGHQCEVPLSKRIR